MTRATKKNTKEKMEIAKTKRGVKKKKVYYLQKEIERVTSRERGKKMFYLK